MAIDVAYSWDNYPAQPTRRIKTHFDRLLRDELTGLVIEEPVPMGAELSRNNRGACVLIEFLVIVVGEPTVGCFYDVDNLPQRFIEE